MNKRNMFLFLFNRQACLILKGKVSINISMTTLNPSETFKIYTVFPKTLQSKQKNDILSLLFFHNFVILIIFTKTAASF